MSSILDALNKLEEEKAARRAEQEGVVEPISPDKAALELLGASDSRGERRPARHPRLQIVGALFVGVAAASALFALLSLTRSTTPDTIATAVPAPGQTQTYTLPAMQADPPPVLQTGTTPMPADAPRVLPTPPMETLTLGADSASKPPPPLPAPRPTATQELSRPAPAPSPQPDTPTIPAEPVFEPPAATLAKTPEPAPSPVVLARAESELTSFPSAVDIVPQAPVLETAASPGESLPLPTAPLPSRPTAAPPAARPAASGAVDINDFPRLSSSDRDRLGLENLRLNVLRAADKDHPEALAIINLKKVFVGEMIPGTRARLIAVQANGIAIEMEGTQERYRISR